MEFNSEQYNRILFKTMKSFQQFCDKHNLTYYVSGGTAIGAVRHHGIIPWDDDIDVYMLRPDYERFLSLRDELCGSGYEIVDIRDDGYYLPYAKYCDANTSIWEESKFRFMLGIFIDIFPLDNAFEDFNETKKWKERYTRKWYSYLNSIRRHTWKEFTGLVRQRDIRHTVHLIADLFLFRPTKWLWKPLFLKYDGKTRSIDGPNLLFYQCSYALKREIFPKEWFREYAELPYEDFTVKAPGEYHKYLCQLFGDYMQLPPVEKRVTRHYHHYVNLDKRVSIEQAEKELLAEKA